MLVKLSRTIVFKWLQLNSLQFEKTKTCLLLLFFFPKNLIEYKCQSFKRSKGVKHRNTFKASITAKEWGTKNTKLKNKIWILNGEILLNILEVHRKRWMKLPLVFRYKSIVAEVIYFTCVNELSEWEWTHSKLNGKCKWSES